MRYPSIKTIATRLNIDAAKAKRVRGIIDGTLVPEAFTSVQAWVAKCYSMPSITERKMEALNELLEGFGVEALRSEAVPWDRYYGDIVGTYINMGDLYISTIYVDRTNRFQIGAPANWIECENY